MTTNLKNEIRKKRNQNQPIDDQNQLPSFSCKFTPPYSDKDAINEKIRMKNIFGEHPFGRSNNETPDDTNNLHLNALLYQNNSKESKLNSVTKNDVKYAEIEQNFPKCDELRKYHTSKRFETMNNKLEEIFKIMQAKPLIKNVFYDNQGLKLQNDLNLSEDENEINSKNDFENTKVIKNDKRESNEIEIDITKNEMVNISPCNLIQCKSKNDNTNNYLIFSSNCLFSHSSSPTDSSSETSSAINSTPDSVYKSDLNTKNNNCRSGINDHLLSNDLALNKEIHDRCNSYNLVLTDEKLNDSKSSTEPKPNHNDNSKNDKILNNSFTFALDPDDLDESLDTNVIGKSIDINSKEPDEVIFKNQFEDNGIYTSDESQIQKPKVEIIVNSKECDYNRINDINSVELSIVKDNIDTNNENSYKYINDSKINQNEKIDYDKNGNPVLIISIDLGLLNYCPDYLRLESLYTRKDDYNSNNRYSKTFDLNQNFRGKNNKFTNNSNQIYKRNIVEDATHLIHKKPKVNNENFKLFQNHDDIHENKSTTELNSVKVLESFNTSTLSCTKMPSLPGYNNANALVKPNSRLKPLTHFNPKMNFKHKINETKLANLDNIEGFHTTGIAKKHEADNEKESIMRKIMLYMEAVCNFCLYAISQYRQKKTKTVKSIEILNQTWKLLKHVNDNYVDGLNTKNIDFVKKFKVLSNWMECFIFHWLWKLNLNECKKLSSTLNGIIRSLNSSSNQNSAVNSSSPVEIPSSPNSVCSGSSQSGHQSLISQSDAKFNQINELNLLRDLHTKVKSYVAINDYNVRSQLRWDYNEWYINGDRNLIDFKETIESQVRIRLYVNCEVEDFSSCIFCGLQLLQLNS